MEDARREQITRPIRKAKISTAETNRILSAVSKQVEEFRQVSGRYSYRPVEMVERVVLS